ncbi:MAG: radical SAM protein [bacterium]|nr:radical SAM protein [bacterium]
MLLEPVLYDLLETTKNSVTGLKEVHPDFYQALIKNQFIVESNLDEVKQVKDYSHLVDSNESHYLLIINPTMNCNFKCWYCYESHESSSKMTIQTIESVKKLITKIVSDERIKSFSLSWFGGEPLLYFKDVIKPISEYTLELCEKHNVLLNSDYTTNGYLINEETANFFKRYKTRQIQITLDGNREKHNTIRYISKTKGSYDVIIKNVSLLCDKGLSVRLRINYTEETLKGIRDIIDDLKIFTKKQREFLQIAFHQVWQDDSNLTEETNLIIKEFRDKGFFVTTHDNPDNVRSSCYADRVNHSTINYNGEVFKCTARDFNSKNKEGDLTEEGNIIWNEKHNIRMDSKFKNSPCLDCNILPICNGGCTQHAIDNENKDYCIYKFDKEKINQVVLNKFLQTIDS